MPHVTLGHPRVAAAVLGSFFMLDADATLSVFSNLSPGGGSASNLAQLQDFIATLDDFNAHSIEASPSSKLAVALYQSLLYSPDGGVSWSRVVDLMAEAQLFQAVEHDYSNRDVVWSITLPDDFGYFDNSKVPLFGLPNDDDCYGPPPYTGLKTDWYADVWPVKVYRSTSAGASWNLAMTQNIGSIWPTRISPNFFQYGGITGHPPGDCASPWDDVRFVWGGNIDFTYVDNMLVHNSALTGSYIITPPISYTRMPSGWPAIQQAMIAPLHDGTNCYAIVSGWYYDNHFKLGTRWNGETNYAPGMDVEWNIRNIVPSTDPSGPDTLYPIYSTLIWLLDGVGGSTLKQFNNIGFTFYRAVADPGDSDKIYLQGDASHTLNRISWSAETITTLTTPFDGYGIFDLKVAPSRSIFVLCQTSGNYRVYRSDDQASTWSLVYDDTGVGNLVGFLSIEVGADNTLAVISSNGIALYSTDDGRTWNASGAVGYADWVQDAAAV